MQKFNQANQQSNVENIINIGVIILAFLFAFLDFLLDILKSLYPQANIPSISTLMPKVILFVLGFLFLSIMLERRKRLDNIQSTLDKIVNNYSLGAQYLEDADTVSSALERMVRQSNETVMSLGARSRAMNYLNAINEAVSDRSVIHYRLIAGSEIPHELHDHLKNILGKANVQIAWTHKEKFGNLTVTEHECVIAFPAPYRNKLSGLRLPSETNSRKYTQYFLDAFSKALPIRTEEPIKTLCETCSPKTAGNSDEVRKVIAAELQSFVNKQGSTSPELL